MTEQIVLNGVTYYANQHSNEDNSFKIKWESLKLDIQHQLQSAQVLYEEATERGLSTSMIEAEGFLRAIHAVNDIIDSIEFYDMVPNDK